MTHCDVTVSDAVRAVWGRWRRVGTLAGLRRLSRRCARFELSINRRLCFVDAKNKQARRARCEVL